MTRLNLGCGQHQLAGFENLDLPDWQWEDGLTHGDASVDAVTASHTLMYVAIDDWPFVLSEIHRVLAPGGILRVTEDNTEDPESERFGGYTDAVTLTGPRMMRAQLKQAGFRVREYGSDKTGFHDDSLLQAWHGAAPKCFWMEARKP